MRFFFGGPRIGGVRTGVSVGKEDFKGSPRTLQRKKALRAMGWILLVTFILVSLLILSYAPSDAQWPLVGGVGIGTLLFWGLAHVLG